MWTLLLGVTFGLLASFRSASAQAPQRSRSCSHRGVFHVEGVDRYSLTFDMAKKLCDNLGTNIASKEQVIEAHSNGLETCRYGWIDNGNTTILRHNAHVNCSNNMTGVLFRPESPEQKFDAFCYNVSDLSAKNCIAAIRPVLTDSESVQDTDASVTLKPNRDVTEQPMSEDEANSQATQNDPDQEEPQATNTSFTDQSPSEDSVPSEPDTQSPTEEASTPREPAAGFTVQSMWETDNAGSGTQDPVRDVEEAFSSAPPVGEPGEPQGPVKEGATGGRAVPKGRMNPGATPSPGGRERSRTPLWLIIVAVVVGVCTIIIVCAAVAKRRSWCGQQQTLMISNKDGSEVNSAAVASFHTQEREQEMVTLMNKEKIQENGNKEEFTVITLEESPQK